MNYKLNKKRVRERTWRLIQLISAVLLVVLLVIVGFLFYATLSDGEQGRPNNIDAHYPSLNILVAVDGELEGELDSAFLLRLDIEHEELVVTALDVSLEVEFDGHSGPLGRHYDYGTVALLRLAVEELLGIEVDRYAVVGSLGFAAVVDGFGGVVFEVAQNLEIAVPDGLPIIVDSGISTLSGTQAFGVLGYENWRDISTLEVQENLIAAIIDTRLSVRNLERSSVNFNIFVNGSSTNISVMDSVRYLSFLEKLVEGEQGVRVLSLVVEDGVIDSRSLAEFRNVFGD